MSLASFFGLKMAAERVVFSLIQQKLMSSAVVFKGKTSFSLKIAYDSIVKRFLLDMKMIADDLFGYLNGWKPVYLPAIMVVVIAEWMVWTNLEMIAQSFPNGLNGFQRWKTILVWIFQYIIIEAHTYVLCDVSVLCGGIEISEIPCIRVSES